MAQFNRSLVLHISTNKKDSFGRGMSFLTSNCPLVSSNGHFRYHGKSLRENGTARRYLSLPPTRHDLTQGQKPEGRLKWGIKGRGGRERAETQTLLVSAAHRLT